MSAWEQIIIIGTKTFLYCLLIVPSNALYLGLVGIIIVATNNTKAM